MVMIDEERYAKRAEYQRKWRAANPDKVKENSRKDRERNGEKRRAAAREWYRKNTAKVRERERRRYDETREARNAKRRQTTYGLTQEQIDTMTVVQGGVCKICGLPPTGKGRNGKLLHIDHCHDTGRVRGLLCNSCNRGMGLLGDDPERLAAAITYLTLADV